MRATGRVSALREAAIASICTRASAGFIASIGFNASLAIASMALTICGCRFGIISPYGHGPGYDDGGPGRIPALKRSTDRILTTHVGSLPRPKAMLDLIVAREAGAAVDEAEFEARAAQSVAEIVARQVACGIDIVSDGEQSKPSSATYVKHRVAGIGMDPSVVERGRDAMVSLDRLDHPDFVTATNFSNTAFPACLGPLSYSDR